MARPTKRFGEHSERWQREQKAAGVESSRWDRWLGLSPKSRAETDPAKYSQGWSVQALTRSANQDKAAQHIHSWAQQSSGKRVDSLRIQKNVRNLTARELKRIPTMTPTQMRRSARNAHRAGKTGSPFYYK